MFIAIDLDEIKNHSSKVMRMSNSIDCPSCGHKIRETYCPNCGEKRLLERDFQIGRIVEEAIGLITNLDTKLFRTIRALFLQPGKLSAEFVRGARVRYMKPFQLFIVANLLFFLFLSGTDIFRTPSVWFFTENYDGIRVLDKVREIMDTRNLSQAEIALMYDNKSTLLAKGFVVVLLPFLALFALLLHWRQKLAFGKHLIFAMHYFSFILVFCVIWTEVVKYIIQRHTNLYYIIPIQTAITVYLILAFKHFYQQSWWSAIWKGLIGTLLIGILIQVYKMCINAWALYHI